MNADAVRNLREALRNLSLEPDELRAELLGMVVTDELALDLDNAVSSVNHASEVEGFTRQDTSVFTVRTAKDGLMLTMPPGRG
jgi:hypothetical protein